MSLPIFVLAQMEKKPPVTGRSETSAVNRSNIIHPKYGYSNDQVKVTFTAAGVNTVTFVIFISSESCMMPPLQGTAKYNSNTNRWEGMTYERFENLKTAHGIIKFESVDSGQKLLVHTENISGLGAACSIGCSFSPCIVLE